MTINTTLAGLSQNQALNGPDGSSDPPAVFDDAQRYTNSFVAMLRDGVGFSAGAIAAGLGFTPVRQGTGPGQGTNQVSIGWSASLTKLLCSVDNNGFSNQWPIDISGFAGSAGLATNANNAYACSGTAANANAINGISGWNYNNAGTATVYLWGTDGSSGAQRLCTPSTLSVGFASSAGTCSSAASCSGNSATASTATNANALGGIGPSGWCQAGGSLISLTNSAFSQMVANVGGTSCFWGMSPSDIRLKENVAPTQRDSLADIAGLDFIGFNYKRLSAKPVDHEGNEVAGAEPIQIDDGRFHPIGFSAQQAEGILPDWIVTVPGGIEGEHKQPDLLPMLSSALHAIKQLSAANAALVARVAALESRSAAGK